MNLSLLPKLTTACALLAVAGCATRIDDAKAQSAAARLSRGQALIAQADYRQALAECQAGIDELGVHPPTQPVCEANGRPVTLIDHTGEQLLIAGMLQRDGKLQDAAQSICSVLRKRISIARLSGNPCRGHDGRQPLQLLVRPQAEAGDKVLA